MAKERKRRGQPLKPSEQVAAFIEGHCVTPEGTAVGKPFILRPWQREILQQCYDSPTRRMIVTIPRKNGKTGLAASLLLAHLSGPVAVRNSQIYSTAMSRDQAAVIFGLASKMCRMSPELSQWVNIRESGKALDDRETGVSYRALSAESSTAYGLSPIMTFHDELGQVRGPVHELYDAMESGAGAHRSPLSLIISTQAPSDNDLLSVLIDDAKRGDNQQSKLFYRAAEDGDDIFAEATWRKANPALGDFLHLSVLAEEAEVAKRLPARAAAFQNLRLNMRVEAKARYIAQTIWAMNSGKTNENMLEDAVLIVGGLDLSARQDLTALVLAAVQKDGTVAIFPYFWLPEDGVSERSRKEHVPYDEWAKRGFVTLCPGKTVDYEFVAAKIGQLCANFDISKIAYDRWRIGDLKRELDRHEIKVELAEFGQGFKDMSPALEDMETLLFAGKIMHNDHPVLCYCAESAVVVMDPAGNRKLDKARATGRIDGMVAMAMAVRLTTQQPAKKRSVYSSRGILFA